MKHTFTLIFAVLLLIHGTARAAESSSARPNVLFIIADDASRHFGEAYGCNWVNTPNIDRLAKSGLVFDNAYTPTSKCAPSRASILTGRNPWQLEDAANHQPYFPAKFMAFSEALAKAGVQIGGAGKTWGPGEAKLADGSQRDFALGGGGRDANNPGAGLTAFLKKRTPGTPFFYWFGSHYPHRSYKVDSGIAAGKKPSDIDKVPAYWPDNDLIRRDMLDYAIEVEAYDAQVGSLLAALDASGEAKNTLIIVTSDHGMPFPRVKGHTYDDAHHIPFVVTWPAGIAKPGRRVPEFISFIDLAPTFLELFGVDGVAQGMSPITASATTCSPGPAHLRVSAIPRVRFAAAICFTFTTSRLTAGRAAILSWASRTPTPVRARRSRWKAARRIPSGSTPSASVRLSNYSTSPAIPTAW
jgi:N-sulfoglucosamine sulfohydrolase